MHPLLRSSLPALLLAVPLSACGGGGGGNNTPATLDRTIGLPLALALTGSMNSIGEYGDTSISGYVAVGDDYRYGVDMEDRCFLTFDLASMPTGVTITKAEIRLAGRVSYGNPFALLGAPLVDHMNMGGSVTINDFADAIAGSVAIFPQFTNAIGYQPGAFLVTSQVRTDYQNALPVTSFKLRFSAAPFADGQLQLVEFQVSQNDPALRPTLVVTYL